MNPGRAFEQREMKFGGVSIDLLVLYVGDDDGSYQADSLQPAGDCTYTVYFPPGNATRPPWSVQDVRLFIQANFTGRRESLRLKSDEPPNQSCLKVRA